MPFGAFSLQCSFSCIYCVYMNYEFQWDNDNLAHATRHSISAKEAEECFENEYLMFPKPLSVKRHGEQRFYLLGRSNGGKPVFIVFKWITKTCIRIITTRRMTTSEENKYGI